MKHTSKNASIKYKILYNIYHNRDIIRCHLVTKFAANPNSAFHPMFLEDILGCRDLEDTFGCPWPTCTLCAKPLFLDFNSYPLALVLSIWFMLFDTCTVYYKDTICDKHIRICVDKFANLLKTCVIYMCFYLRFKKLLCKIRKNWAMLTLRIVPT